MAPIGQRLRESIDAAARPAVTRERQLDEHRVQFEIAGVAEQAHIPHPTRGAHPIAEAFIYECPRGYAAATEAMRILAREVGADTSSGHRDRRPLRLGDRSRERDDAWLDALMLRTAADEFRKGQPLFVRTQLLAPAMHPTVLFNALTSLDQRVLGNRWIVGIVESRRPTASPSPVPVPPRIAADDEARPLASHHVAEPAAAQVDIVRQFLRALLALFRAPHA